MLSFCSIFKHPLWFTASPITYSKLFRHFFYSDSKSSYYVMSKISSPKHQLSEAQKQPKREMLKFVNLLALPIRIFNAGMASKSASVTRKAKKTKFESGKGPTLTRSWINDVSLSFLLSSPLFILPRLTYRINSIRSSCKTFYQDSSFLRCHWANLKITCCMSNTHPKICKWRLLVAR